MIRSGFDLAPQGNTCVHVIQDRIIRSVIKKHMARLPDRAWTTNDNIVSPCPIEMAVLTSVSVTVEMINSYKSQMLPLVDTDKFIDDRTYTHIIGAQLQLRLCPMLNMTRLVHCLVFVCKELVEYDHIVVQAFLTNYSRYGTKGFEELGKKLEFDGAFDFFMYVMEIKIAVYELLSSLDILDATRT